MRMPSEPIAITVESGPSTGRVVSSSGAVVTLGRLASNDLALPDDPQVSAHHARLLFDGDAWAIEDLCSRNGTFVDADGVRTRVQGRVLLRRTSRVLVGRTMLVLSVQAPSGPSVASSLRVTVSGDLLRYETSSAGAVDISHTTRYVRDDLDELAARLRAVAVESHSLRPDDASRREELLKETLRLGRYAGERFLPAAVRHQLESQPSDSLFIRHDPELLSLPWELMVLKDEFLCLRQSLGRQVVVSDIPVGNGSNGPARPLRCLIAADPRDDLPEARLHATQLLETLRPLYPEVEFSFLSGSRLQRMDLLVRLSESDVVYYVGHAVHDARNPGSSGWLLKRDRVTAEDFRALPKAPTLVFANGCQTGEEASWTEGGLLSYTPYGLASGFMLAGAKAYLGALWPIPAKPSMVFAREFMGRLFAGCPLGECVRKARLRVTDEWGRSELVWAAYTLFGDPVRRVLSCEQT